MKRIDKNKICWKFVQNKLDKLPNKSQCMYNMLSVFGNDGYYEFTDTKHIGRNTKNKKKKENFSASFIFMSSY